MLQAAGRTWQALHLWLQGLAIVFYFKFQILSRYQINSHWLLADIALYLTTQVHKLKLSRLQSPTAMMVFYGVSSLSGFKRAKNRVVIKP